MDWYQHNIDSYDADTLGLTLAEHGAYLRLIHWYYKKERPIPNDEIKIAVIIQSSVDEWRAVSKKVTAYFFPQDSQTGESELHHRRCDKYILEHDSKRKNNSDRQERLRKRRKHNMLEDVTRDSRVSHAPVTLLEERRGEEILTKKKEGLRRIGRSETASDDALTKRKKKERWESQMISYVFSIMSTDDATDLVARYAAGEVAAKREFNRLDERRRGGLRIVKR